MKTATTATTTTATRRLRTSLTALALLGATATGMLAAAPAAGAAATPAAATAATAQTSTAALASTTSDAASILSSVRRNCGIVTCSWYLSKKVTRNLKDMIGAGTTFTTGAAYMVCSKIPHPAGMAVCAAAILYKGAPAAYNITAGANRGGCFVIRVNMAYMASGVPALQLAKGMTFSNVGLSNKYCDAS
ncbi:hypothetical protein [Sphaerisporangium album]|uniref:hypothetical protein n=1 Tax=Sphaerisporangium album TaxID=509200 RepID=UPI0015F0DB7C|nr:hypothetical protein [Sphaerisporangium album]